jgi:hypothetical protein
MVCNCIPKNYFPQGLAKTGFGIGRNDPKKIKIIFVHNLQAFSSFLVTTSM